MARITSIGGAVCAAVVCVSLVSLVSLVSVASAVDVETVPVSNTGNTGELSGAGAGGAGPDRVCGAVPYVYAIGKTEVTNAQYCEYLNTADPGGVNPHDLYDDRMETSQYGGISFDTNRPAGSKYELKVRRGPRPVNFVTFWDACRFANWLHNDQGSGDTETGAYTLTDRGIADNSITRNPGALWAVTSEDEWYKGAYHKNNGDTGHYWDYPTESDTAPVAEFPPGTGPVASANYGWVVVQGMTDAGAYTTKPSDSPYGTFDQAGSVYEWNEAIIDSSKRGIRGGSFYSTTDTLTAARRGWDEPDIGDSSVGFRVAQVPEPATFALIALGGLALIRRRCCGVAATATGAERRG
jgi:formylglycine-generating enzyme required for sulfatase activity